MSSAFLSSVVSASGSARGASLDAGAPFDEVTATPLSQYSIRSRSCPLVKGLVK